MNKIKLLGVAIMAVMFLVSCGGGSSDVNYDKKADLKPNEKTVKGYLSDVFQVADGTYKLDFKGGKYTGKGKIQVKIKSIGNGNANDYGLQDGNSGPLYLTVCDNNGAPITNFDNMSSSYKGDDLLKDMLKKKGEENWIEFEINTYSATQLPDEASTFFITSKEIKEREKSSTSSNISKSKSSASKKTVSNEDWDKVLKSYESYIDQYIKLMKKATNGDASAMTEYAEMMVKATDLSEKMSNAGDDLSASQMTKFMKLQTKLATAAAEMYN